MVNSCTDSSKQQAETYRVELEKCRKELEELKAASKVTPEIKSALESLERLKANIESGSSLMQYNITLADAKTKINILERTNPPVELLQEIKSSYNSFYKLAGAFKTKITLDSYDYDIQREGHLKHLNFSNMEEFESHIQSLILNAFNHLENAYNYQL
jgi:hypothetical protein